MAQQPQVIKWSEDLDTGNVLIDSQHRMLVFLCRKLQLAYDAGLEHNVIVGLCIELKKFADFHFTSEENVMREVGYPGYDSHVRAHSQLLFELDNWIRRVHQRSEMPAALLGVMTEWMIGHIRGDDVRLAGYIKISGTHPMADSEYGLYLR